MKSWHAFHITGPLCGESTVTSECFPQRACDAEPWCIFVFSLSKLLDKELICQNNIDSILIIMD